MNNFVKVFDPEFVNFFREYSIVDSFGRDLFEIIPLTNRGNAVDNVMAPKQIADPMLDTASPERRSKVQALRAAYAELEPLEQSPFEC